MYRIIIGDRNPIISLVARMPGAASFFRQPPCPLKRLLAETRAAIAAAKDGHGFIVPTRRFQRPHRVGTKSVPTLMGLAVLADALCAYHGLAPLLALNIRFKDKALLWSLSEEYGQVRSEQALTNLLGKFDAFNQAYPIED